MKSMVKNGIIIAILVLLEAGMGYYSMAVNDRLFTRFLFFLLSAGLVCLVVIKCIHYTLPREDLDREKIDK